MSIDTQVSDSERTAETLPVARVLVVDDERSMRELLSIVLRRDGYDVLLAADGKAAVDS
jgi:CheY-like chemotaxis protein